MAEGSLADDSRDYLWAIYAWWTCVLALKMMTLVWFTGLIRKDRQVIHSEEDRMWLKSADVILCPSGGGHPDVDRIRSAHYHDLQLVVPFALIVPLWLRLAPEPLVVAATIRLFAFASVSYTLVRMNVVSVGPVCGRILHATERSLVAFACVMCATGYLSAV